ncbi:hypothetical protein B0A49_03191 [Cryomyces minteri]|uniref:Uncharacterized protein n=1 Tax=Cryomyces minteri TaxID=331657 RepID=A0A4U0XRX4_9PEZI|nr:hypothetical protein B0A49_03191 [Cryomyces minteri]
MDEFDLNFRDETKAVKRKACKALANKRGSSSLASIFSVPQISQTSDVSSTSVATRHAFIPGNSSFARAYNEFVLFPILPTLTLSVDSQAIAFFFKNFVLPPRSSDAVRGFLEELPELYNNSSPSSPLHLAVSAVSLSTLGNSPGRRDLLQKAGATYGRALREVNRAIQNPATATSNATLASVLLFSLYETIASSDLSMSAWLRHIEGAIALVKSRGTEQFNNPQSLSLFRAVRTQMLTSCIQRSAPVEDFPGAQGWMSDKDLTPNAANRLTAASMKVPDIRALAKKALALPKTPSNESEVLALMQASEDADTDLRRWEETLPGLWDYLTVAVVTSVPEDLENSETWSGPIHIYEDMHIASVRNNQRVSRIFCQSIIMGCLAWLSPGKYRTDERLEAARYTVQNMVDNICASVPFHLGFDLRDRLLQTGQDESAAQAVGGYFLLWPLFVAASMDCVSTEQRVWLQGRLSKVAGIYGLDQRQLVNAANQHTLTSEPVFEDAHVELAVVGD